ncbi:MAG TPA: PilZ domain-containing protein [Verrucomicrobiae bacterium]|jgi:hypothetical protein|nr:PilZ domain-containing protein [Verrucomicrobiae bacterium]
MRNFVQGRWPLRGHARFAIDLRLIIRTNIRIYGRTKDISEGGLGATVPYDLPLGELVEVEFQFPDAPEPLALNATVHFREGFHYGFKLIEPTRRQLETIRRETRSLPVIR